MLATTIPVTKTSASRLTPDLRDKSAFGAVFSDHMLVADYANGTWGDPHIIPYGAQMMAAAPAVAHYGQGIFEGFKAFPRPGGGAVLFRPQANHARMNRTCQRMAMPEVPASIFVDGTAALVQLDRNWIPESDGAALYIRPVMFATGEPLGVRPSDTFRFIIETCPSGPYFSGAVDLIAEDVYVRAFPGGTGAAKCGGNYAGSMLAALEAQQKGFHNVLWLDGIERKYVEEAGLMNVVFVINGTVVTPPLGGTILPGITRDSVLTLLREMKVPIEERMIAIDEVFEAHAAGTLDGAAGVGTAAVIAPLGRIRHKDREITVKPMGTDSVLARVGAELEGIRSGRIADRHGWLMTILAMPYFALIYDVVDDFVNQRTPFRPAHLAGVREAQARGELIMAGALGEPAGALLVFRGADKSVAENFAVADPYVNEGLVTKWQIRPWTVVVGQDPSETPPGLPN